MGKGSKNEKGSASPPDPSLVWLRSCEKETVEPVDGEVKGNIPSWLSGRLTRNGPGRVQYGDTKFNHLFDGSAYIHQFNIADGKVTYQSRFLNCDTYKQNSRANRIIVNEFGTAGHPDPCKTLLQRFMSFFTPLSQVDPTDNCVVSVCHFGDQLYALTETKNMRRIDPKTLDTVGEKTKLDRYVAVNTSTAHPHVDPDGTIYNMGNSFAGKKGPTYNIIKFPPTKTENGNTISSVEQAEIIVTIPCQWKLYPSYYHSFGISENYFIFIEQPFVFNLKKFLVNHYMGKPYFSAVEWHGDKKTKFRVVRRSDGHVLTATYATDPFLTFHHTNAYEQDGQLVVDTVSMEVGEVVNQAMLKNLENPNFENAADAMPTQRRYVLPLNTQDVPFDTNLVTLEGSKCSAYKREDGTIEVKGHVISKQFFDLPRINYKHNGKHYTFAYGVEVNPKGVIFSSVVKMNVDSGETWKWSETGRVVSEPVFVAAPEATREDQGVVLTSLIDKERPTFVGLVILDAETWKELGRAEFQANGTVTSTFHGQFAAPHEAVHIF